ncbi:uncharacterized protein LOC134690757 [Mytilus trossulus]|uniref:uncharacterized protein LOC134690757 n=1 Tax=Mytilus trossulus TaxID=6551 RepID=UPI003006BC98
MAEPLIHCGQHTTEILNLFCCKCEEVICVHCLIESHQKHEMKHLFDAKKVIHGQLSRILTTDDENITDKIKEAKDFVSNELSDSDTDEKQVCKQIEKSSESEKDKIESQTENLTEILQTKYATYRQTVKAIVQTVIETETRIAEMRKSGNGIDDFEWTEQVELYSNIKKSTNSLETMVKIKKDMKPRFVPTNDFNNREIIIGFIEIGEKIAVSNELSEVISQGIYSDLNTERTPLKQTNTSDTHEESSSDEVRNEYPITIELNASVKKPVSKIIPISDEDAWIICENKLCKLKNCKVEDTLYTERVDDIAILGDGSLLLLQRESTYIKRLLGKRISNFAYPGTKIPQCLHVMTGNNVIILLDHSGNESEDQLGQKKREVVQVTNHGVVQVAFSFLYDTDAIPNAVTVRNSSDLYIIFRDTYYTPERASIVRMDLKTKTLDEEIIFTGAIGIDVNSQFISYGLCFEPSGKILVSDQNHHSVLLIDNMKYVKSVYFADHGLDSPGALAFFNGILWIVDDTKVHKFRYK